MAFSNTVENELALVHKRQSFNRRINSFFFELFPFPAIACTESANCDGDCDDEPDDGE
jgi:hypothetical protein